MVVWNLVASWWSQKFWGLWVRHGGLKHQVSTIGLAGLSSYASSESFSVLHLRIWAISRNELFHFWSRFLSSCVCWKPIETVRDCCGVFTMGQLGCDCFLIVLLIPCRHISRDATSPVISISLWSHPPTPLCHFSRYTQYIIRHQLYRQQHTPFVFHPIQKMTGLGEAPPMPRPMLLMHKIINQAEDSSSDINNLESSSRSSSRGYQGSRI